MTPGERCSPGIVAFSGYYFCARWRHLALAAEKNLIDDSEQRAKRYIQERSGLFVLEGFDGIEAGGTVGRQGAEEDAHEHGGRQGDDDGEQ